MSNDINVYAVVKKLLGPIKPVGESRTDDQRFENLKQTTELVNLLLTDIDNVIPCKNNPQHSMKKAGEFADKFYDQIGIKE